MGKTNLAVSLERNLNGLNSNTYVREYMKALGIMARLTIYSCLTKVGIGNDKSKNFF
jgi:hypothetical protein